MVSQTAKEDVCALEMQGVKLTFEEIIRLNALGCRCENHPDSPAFYALPRCAFVQSGDDVLTLREPTIGQELWFQNSLRLFDDEDETTLFLLRAMSMAMDYELPPWSDPKKVADGMKQFLQDKVGSFTARQVMVAVNYCLFGCDALSGENPIMPDEERKDDKDTCSDTPELSTAIGVIHQAQALRLGISMKDMKDMTSGELQAVVDDAMARDELISKKGKHDNYVAEYYATLNAIKNRHSEGLNNGQ